MQSLKDTNGKTQDLNLEIQTIRVSCSLIDSSRGFQKYKNQK